MDVSLFRLLNSLAGRWSLVDALGLALAKYGLALALIGVVILAVRQRDARRFLASVARILVAILVGLSLAYTIGHMVNRPRPFMVEPVHQLLPHEPEPSWPSEHVTVLSAMAGVIVYEDALVGVAMFLVAFLIGLSRVFVGVHYPGDVAAGLLLGGSVALAIRGVHARLMKAGATNLVKGAKL